MLCKLAWGNVRRAGKDYLVYLLTLTLAVTVFYAFNTISIQVDFVSMEEGLSQLLGGIFSGLTFFLAAIMGFLMVYANGFIMKRRKKEFGLYQVLGMSRQLLGGIFSGLTFFLAAIMGFLMVYANGFIMKRRKKEFGLYQVLGMSRGQVARVMALETAIVSGAALVLGIALGVGFSQLMTFFTASIFKTQIADFHFFFSMQALSLTVGCLFVIFLVTLAFNLLVVGRTKIIDLMSASRLNEAIKTRSPLLSAVVFVLGTVLIGVAYFRLLRDGMPVDTPVGEMDEAMNQLALTTGIVVVGTILFFFGLSGFLLKALQGAKGLYWRGLNMFTLRQLSAKVNTVSFSMAMISMFLFLAITSVTSGMSIANVMITSVERNNPADYSRVVIYYGEDLMSASRLNEAIKTRSPLLSAVVFVLGTVLIGVAYFRLLRDGMPVDTPVGEMDEAMNQLALTTGIVVVGTILFFFGLSGFLLKALQGAKGLYWRGLNMFTLRQLSAKVNTVSFSMAMISMFLFLAITSVTSGMSIANVMITSVERNNPADYSRVVIYYGERTLANSQDSDHPMAIAEKPFDIVEASGNDEVNAELPNAEPYDLDGILGERVQVEAYDSTPRGETEPVISLNQLCEAVDMPLPVGTESSNSNVLGLQVMKESDYNRYRAFRGLGAVDLGLDGYLLTSDMGETVNKVYDAAMAEGVVLDIAGVKLHPCADEVDEGASTFTNSTMGSNSGTVIVPDYLVEKAGLPLYTSYLLGNYRKGLSYEETEGYVREPRMWSELLDANGNEVALWGMDYTRIEAFESTNTMNGLISYLAIYIGFVLVIACAAILTIQHLSGVSDSAKNCRILSELGTSRHEIMRSMLAQQAVFFLFPLVVGVAHSLVALHVVIEIVALFGGISIGMTVAATCAIFLLCYGGYFAVTYFMSKGIVSDAIRVRHAH